MLTINISELVLTVLSFFVLMFLLNKLLFKPVISFREQRQSRMEQCFEQERLANDKQTQAKEAARRQRVETLRQADSLAAQAKQQAEESSAQALKQLEQETAATLEQAEQQAAALHSSGTEELAQKQHSLAKTLADRLSQ
jgi:F-type H+-transporting ATPase subunit b